jgi:undecaprenyl-diphosphatase
MNIFWAIILGIVQGLTEFFPVSSSAHLAIIPWMFKFPDPGLAFDIALHAGTFFAILFALKTDWIKLATSLLKKEDTLERKLVGFLVITSVPGAIIGYLFESKAESAFRAPMIVAVTLTVFGLILWAVDRYAKKAEELSKMNWKSSLIIGLSQALAIVPGVSRSGATITAGRALGFSREAAVKYSFLAALPIIFGAAVFGLRHATFSELTSANWILGCLAAFISSFFAIKWLTSYVKKHSFDIFLYYRLAFAAIIAILFYLKG